jgi:hypothetical protein
LDVLRLRGLMVAARLADQGEEWLPRAPGARCRQMPFARGSGHGPTGKRFNVAIMSFHRSLSSACVAADDVFDVLPQ